MLISIAKLKTYSNTQFINFNLIYQLYEQNNQLKKSKQFIIPNKKMRRIFSITLRTLRSQKINSHLPKQSLTSIINYNFSSLKKDLLTQYSDKLDQTAEVGNQNIINRFYQDNFDQILKYGNSTQHKNTNSQNLLQYIQLLIRMYTYNKQTGNNIRTQQIANPLFRQINRIDKNIIEHEKEERFLRIWLKITGFLITEKRIQDAREFLSIFKNKCEEQQKQGSIKIRKGLKLWYYFYETRVDRSLPALNTAYNFILKHQKQFNLVQEKQIIIVIIHDYVMQSHFQNDHQNCKKALPQLQKLLNFDKFSHQVYLADVAKLYCDYGQFPEKGLEILRKLQDILVKTRKNGNYQQLYVKVLARRIEALQKLKKFEELLDPFSRYEQFISKDNKIKLNIYYLNRSVIEYFSQQYEQVKKSLDQSLKVVKSIQIQPSPQQLTEFQQVYQILLELAFSKQHFQVFILLNEISQKFKNIGRKS